MRPEPGKPEFSFPIRVYWEDTDAGGVVYHAAYLCFLERARSEWLRTLGIGQQHLRETEDVAFAVRAMTLEFQAPARLDDVLQVGVQLLRLGRASMLLEQCILRPSDGRLLLQAQVRVACLRASDFRPRGLPQALFERIENCL